MKQIAFLLALMSGFATLTAQKSTASEQPTAVYTVQLGAFDDNVIQSDFEAIRSYAYIYKRNGLVFIGAFPTEEAAEPVLSKVKAKGYDDAFVATRSFNKAKTVYAIQLASKGAGEDINWKTYARVGNLFSMPNAGQVRILHGYYEDINDARVKLKEIQNLGFDDAFLKTVKDVQLNEISVFDTGDKKLTTPSEAVVSKGATVPQSYNVTTSVSTKRKSAIKLQEALKEVGTYGGVIDGQFGKGTSTGFDKAVKFNRQLKMYDELSQKYNNFEGWEDMRLLLTMTRQLSIKDDLQLFTPDLLNNLPEQLLDVKTAKAALDWHANMWKGLEKWSATSQHSDQVYTALKIAYYRSLVHLEDHYAAKGITGDNATALSVSVLKTLIGDYMQGFN